MMASVSYTCPYCTRDHALPKTWLGERCPFEGRRPTPRPASKKALTAAQQLQYMAREAALTRAIADRQQQAVDESRERTWAITRARVALLRQESRDEEAAAVHDVLDGVLEGVRMVRQHEIRAMARRLGLQPGA
jgi:hypothetical protein